MSSRNLGALVALIALFALAFASGAQAQNPVEAAVDEVVGEAAAVAPEELAGKDKGKGDADEDEKSGPAPRGSDLNLRLKGLKGNKLKVGDRFKAAGTLRPFAKGERITIILRRGNKTIARKTQYATLKKPGSKLGQFSFSKKLTKPGRYTVQAVKKPTVRLKGSKDRSKNFKLSFPDLNPGNNSSTVKVFNKLLAKLGYVNDEGKAYDNATERAVLAFRKVNGMSRITDATPAIFKKLAKGKGGYKLRYPESGKHVEADLSKQVMVLARGDKVEEIYHVSSGAPATPTVTGTWRFYRKEPGLNNVEMYYSVYWYKGYATHGYKSVPTYPASHGCLRNPPADSIHIYNWIDIGDIIHVYP